MWVQARDWMLTGDRLQPVTGEVLRSVGLRVCGGVTAAEVTTPDGIAEALPDHEAAQVPHYVLTGVATAGRDVWADYGRRQGPLQRMGAEFVVTVGDDRFQVRHGSLAPRVAENSRVTVTGALELVCEYEWEAFGLVDTRANWFVSRVIEVTGGQVFVDLHRS